MFSFPITICPYHEDVRLTSFTLEILFDRFQTLGTSQLLFPIYRGITAYRIDEGEDVGVKQGERVA